MKKNIITEATVKEIRAELQRLEVAIHEAHGLRGDVIREEGGLFDSGSTHSIVQDIARWTKEKHRLEEILNSSTIVSVDMDSEASKVALGDIVAIQITYQGGKPQDLKLQIDGKRKPTEGIMRVTFASPLAQALLGKEVGEQFTLRPSLDCTVHADGIINHIIKARDLEFQIEEVEEKKPYMLQKRS